MAEVKIKSTKTKDITLEYDLVDFDVEDIIEDLEAEYKTVYAKEVEIKEEDLVLYGYEDDYLEILKDVRTVQELKNVSEIYQEHSNLDSSQETIFDYLFSECDAKYALEHIDDVAYYKGMDKSDVARELVEDGMFGSVSDNLLIYIDFEMLGKDLEGYVECCGSTFYRYD